MGINKKNAIDLIGIAIAAAIGFMTYQIIKHLNKNEEYETIDSTATARQIG